MALIITNQISTDGGSTSEAYLNIQKVDIIKDSELSVFLNLYLNKTARQTDVTDVVKSRQVYSRVGIAFVDVSTDLTTDSIYSVVYSKIKAKLEETGLTVENDI